MPAPPARTEISDTYPNPSDAVARIGFGRLWDYVTGLLGTTGNASAARALLGLSNRATVASAASANIWVELGNQINWTGTVTATGFAAAPQAGAERVLICADAAPFTAGANMLIDGVLSGSTVTCAANDTVIVRAVTTTQFKLSRVRYDGMAQVNPVATATAAGLVPTPPNSTTTFLRGDATFAAVSVPIASTAEAQAGTNNTNAITPLRMREGFNAAGTAPVYACRAWINFNGTGTVDIRASGNVSSITDNGVGDYTVNFTTSLPDANYSTQVTAGASSLSVAGQTNAVFVATATARRILTTNTGSTAAVDCLDISVAIFR